MMQLSHGYLNLLINSFKQKYENKLLSFYYDRFVYSLIRIRLSEINLVFCPSDQYKIIF